MKKIIPASLILGLILGSFSFLSAQESYSSALQLNNEKISVYFFYSQTCPYCKKAEMFLENLKEKYPEIQIKSYEVLGNKQNTRLLLKLFEACGEVEQIRVPAIFIGDEVIIGYLSNEATGSQIEEVINQCLEKECPDPLERLEECKVCECEGEMCECAVCECAEKIRKDHIIQVPLIGRIDLSKMSLPALTVITGALDGLNPCAMWVLLFLIALLVNTRSRKRMWLIGGTFILASGIVYYLILSAWLNLFLVISYVNLTRILIGAFALGVGVWQIKNFITYNPGICKITDGRLGLQARIKNGLKNQAEKLAHLPFTLAILGGVILLALAVNLVEFFCSAGLPTIYTKILSLSQISVFSYYLYLLLYTFVFMLDDIIIFSLAVVTLTKVGLTEKYNYWATLIGGLLILTLGILLIFKPEFLMFG